MKLYFIRLFAAALMLSVFTASFALKKTDYTVTAGIRNALTGLAVSDTIHAEILTPDSVVIAAGDSHVDPRWNYNNQDDYLYCVEIPFQTDRDHVIVRLTHPDYATYCHDVRLTKPNIDAGTFRIRKLSRFERSTMLGEVTVRASVLQVVHKGDTLQFNADAFDLAKGSMLDALIEQMPGVSIDEYGRISVNGRFVDKMLLDGKDFFQGDQFVLMQNLPAYAVKNVKVYEKASLSKELTGRKSAVEEDSYVMDVTLKKGYNNGWIVNAEAGGGTHGRYRGRAFGLGYSKNFRLGAYGFLNNINEIRNPGRQGNWNPERSTNGITATKAGGLDYGYFKPDNTVEFTGNIAAKYRRETAGSLTNTENFLEGGSTYTRSWDNSLQKNFALNTAHNLRLRSKEEGRHNHSIDLLLDYNSDKSAAEHTEGTFGRNIGDAPALRESLVSGWPDDMDAINRYLTTGSGRQKTFHGSIGDISRFKVGSSSDMLAVGASANYSRTDAKEGNHSYYLLQYDGDGPSVRSRSNPVFKDEYGWNIYSFMDFPLSSTLSLYPRIDWWHTRGHNENNWWNDFPEDGFPGNDEGKDNRGVSRRSSSLRAADAVLCNLLPVFDSQNSYETDLTYDGVRAWITLGYQKMRYKNDQPYSDLNIFLEVLPKLVKTNMEYRGAVTTWIGRTYMRPQLELKITGKEHGFMHMWHFSYKLVGDDMNLMDLVPVTFDTDPLNLREGNPDLKRSCTHDFWAYYQSQDWIWSRLMLYAGSSLTLDENKIAMAYAYDRSTGVRTFKPMNVDGNRTFRADLFPTVALDRARKLQFEPKFTFINTRSVDMTSYDDFSSTQKSTVNSNYFSASASLRYSRKAFSVAASGAYKTRCSKSLEDFFTPFTINQFNYGVNGRASLPLGFDVSTDLKMYSNRGFDYNGMNTNQLVWNGRITKTILKGSLMFAVDGYDMLGKVKSITYKVNEQGRTETWVKAIPSYVMFSLSWNFAKKPKE